MTNIHNLGFPRMGAHRELKTALEAYWKGNSTLDELQETGAMLRRQHWQLQRDLDLVPVGDFSFYDTVLDMSFTVGNLPERVACIDAPQLDNAFRLARGRSQPQADEVAGCCDGIQAGEMTKWFDTNYHYIVPEFKSDTTFTLNATRLVAEIREAKQLGIPCKPVILGPLTYLAIGKSKDGSDKLSLLPGLIKVYKELLAAIAAEGIEWVQIDEPILVTELDSHWRDAFVVAYEAFAPTHLRLLLATYFGSLQENMDIVRRLPVQGIHLDTINAVDEVQSLCASLGPTQVLSLGVVNGRNVWKTDLAAVVTQLEPIAKQLGDRLWIAPSCSLLHTPVDLDLENKLDPEVKSWLAFAKQKLEELQVIRDALDDGRECVADRLRANATALMTRRTSTRVRNPAVRAALAAISETRSDRRSCFEQRAAIQANRLQLPQFPTTTIGSFPQTTEIRKVRRLYKSGSIDASRYQTVIQNEIAECVRRQEELGLDVLVHGEAERNDMVEYFGEQLEGFAFSENGWVQSYGSRCVKPPILFGDVSRPKAMTVDWITYAQSLTNKPMKGMLTGPVTILNWSFVRDDQPRSESCQQIALAIRSEVLDLEKAGVQIIQIDEAALREGLPLRRRDWDHYLAWAVGCFRLCANGVADETQIHTHMCYSEFNEIIQAIANMDADVITIETSRSDMELLDVFHHFQYPNAIGPGVYDIHSPNTPSERQIVSLMEKAMERLPASRLWINPDCGLKTRQWKEVEPALSSMVSAAKTLRGTLS